MGGRHLETERAYRGVEHTYADEYKFQVVVEETDLWITIPKFFPVEQAQTAALARVVQLRNELTFWITVNPNFRESLTPLPVPGQAPQIVRTMSMAAEKMNVGPFAAVAGAIAQDIAQFLAGRMLAAQSAPRNVIVENGGDIFMISERDRVVGIMSDPKQGAKVGLAFSARDFPLSVCASSATIGHSLSLGQGNLALVRASEAALADAAATFYGNLLKGKNAITKVLAQAEKDAAKGIQGVFAQCDGKIGLWGKLELVALD